MRIFTATLIIAGYMIIGPFLGAVIVALLANWFTPDGPISIMSESIYDLRPNGGFLMFAYIFGILPAVVGGYYIASRAIERKPFNLLEAYIRVVGAGCLNPIFLLVPLLLIMTPYIFVAALVTFTILQYPTRKILALTKYKILPQTAPMEA